LSINYTGKIGIPDTVSYEYSHIKDAIVLFYLNGAQERKREKKFQVAEEISSATWNLGIATCNLLH
jgi:hypothetical protein